MYLFPESLFRAPANGVRHSLKQRGKNVFIVGYLLMAAAKVIDLVLLIFMWIVIIRAVLSWVNPDPFNPIVRFIHQVTEPVLYRIRAYVPAVFGGIDFSPILVFLGVIFLRTFVVSSLFRLAQFFL
jgi:YggT family protein